MTRLDDASSTASGRLSRPLHQPSISIHPRLDMASIVPSTFREVAYFDETSREGLAEGEEWDSEIEVTPCSPFLSDLSLVF